MKNYLSLKILDKIKWVFQLLGVDYPMMRKILQVKLAMDRRRSSTIINTNKDKTDDNNYGKTMLIYVFIGLMFLVFFFIPASIFIRMTFIFAVLIFMVTSIMISDFSSVLLDLKDKNILLSRPIDSRTVNVTKMVHIFIYLFMITMAYITPTIIAGIITEGLLFGLILILELFFILCIIIVLTSFLYGFILHFFDGEKLKDIINYVQIGISILLLISYQFVGDAFEIFNQDIVFNPSWWVFLLPPAWFAAPFQLILGNDSSLIYIILSIFAMIIPIVGLLLYNKAITPFFERNLSKMSNSSGRKARFLYLRDRVTFKISRYFCNSRMENIFLRFYRNILSQDRRLKLSISTTIGLSVIFPFIFLKDKIDFNSLSNSMETLSQGNSYLWLYSSIIFLATIVSIISYSDDYKGAWIYRVLPIESYSMLSKLRVKVVLLKYALPLIIVIGSLFISFFGVHIWVDLLLMLSNLVLLTTIIARDHLDVLPFSIELKPQKDSSKSTTMIFASLLIGGLLAGLHILLKYLGYSLWFNIIFTVIVTIMLWKRLFKD